MLEKVRLGFIGCGGIVDGHLDSGLEKFPDVEFAGWADLNPKAAEKQAARCGGGQVFSHVEDMLDTVKPDAVYIMLPPFAHGPAERAVISRNIPFFVEKPIHLNYAEAKEFAAEIKKRNLITSVGYMNRYRNSVQRVKGLLQNQPLVMLHGGWLGGPPKKYEGITRWWVQKDKSGGQFLEQTTHTTDLALYFGGEVEEVYAATVRGIIPDRPDFFTAEEGSMVTLKFKSGAVGNLYSSVAIRVGGGISLTVWGSDFRANFKEWQHQLELHLPDNQTESIEGEDKIFYKEDRAFIDAIKAGDPSGILATYQDGLAAAAIAEAADRSFATGQTIKISSL